MLLTFDDSSARLRLEIVPCLMCRVAEEAV